MKQAITKHGKVVPEEVPAPFVHEGAVLIRVMRSCVSAGTELGAIQNSGKSLVQRALEQPENLKQVWSMARTIGVAKTYAKVRGVVDGGLATGYSVAGIVVAVGEGVSEFTVGSSVAAAGSGYASHAEYVVVPRKLVTPLPAAATLLPTVNSLTPSPTATTMPATE
jgi:threonine dehydrogenase-like Zn-dependent dehydrogenase